MKKVIVLSILVFACINFSFGQNLYFTKNGNIRFFSSTPMEDIEATNQKVTSVFNATTGDLEFSALIMAFQFEKALMQEHFNENYMESQKFPKSTFKGKITNLPKIDLSTNGSYPVDVTGKLTIHGVTRDVNTKGLLTVKDGKIMAKSEFLVSPEDYQITIPKLVSEKIAKQIKITVDNAYEPYKK